MMNHLQTQAITKDPKNSQTWTTPLVPTGLNLEKRITVKMKTLPQRGMILLKTTMMKAAAVMLKKMLLHHHLTVI